MANPPAFQMTGEDTKVRYSWVGGSGSWISPAGTDPRLRLCPQVVVQFGKEASQTRDYCVAKNATHRAARPDPSLRKERLLRMTIKLRHYLPLERPTEKPE